MAKKKAKKKATKKKAAKKKVAKKKATKKKAAKKTATKKAAAKKATTKKAAKKTRRKTKGKGGTTPWSERFRDRPGPWTCPKCGPLPSRLQPLYGEDEKHHCPMIDCDAVVALPKEEIEQTERRTGSWPPQRNKGKKAIGKKPIGKK